MQVLGLLGPNGAGKTTSVRILTTLLLPDGGSGEVLGIDVTKDPHRVRGSIGLAGQSATVDENLTGRENLKMIGRLTHMASADIAPRGQELLEHFALTDAADRVVRTYSGGMRRRLDLAGALMHRPPVLFLDEPTTGLDPQGRIELWGVIEDLTATGVTVLLTTQYLEEADYLADYIVVVDHGVVIAEGTASDLKSQLGATVIEVSLRNAEDAPIAAEKLAHIGAVAGGREGAARQCGARRRWSGDARHGPYPRRGEARAHHARVARADARRRVPRTHRARRRATVRERRRGHGHRPQATKEGPMTTIATSPDATAALAPKVGRPHVIGDAMVIAWRNLVNIRRNPQLLVFATIQPVIFILNFRYVFGGAINAQSLGGIAYVNYLMPGIFVQTVVFGALTTAVGLAGDLHLGIIERFKSLPIARSAVLTGRTAADLVRNFFVMILMCIVGFAVGWRILSDVWGSARRDRPDPRVLLLALVDLRVRGSEREGRRDRASRVVPDPGAADLRVVGVHPRYRRCPVGSSPGRSTSRCRSCATPRATSRSACPQAATRSKRSRGSSASSPSSPPRRPQVPQDRLTLTTNSGCQQTVSEDTPVR